MDYQMIVSISITCLQITIPNHAGWSFTKPRWSWDSCCSYFIQDCTQWVQ